MRGCLKTKILLLMACFVSPLALSDQPNGEELSIEISIVGEYERPDEVINRIELPDFLPAVSQKNTISITDHTSRLTGPSAAIDGATIALEAKEAALVKRTEAFLKHVPDIKVDVDVPVIDLPQFPNVPDLGSKP